MQELFSNDAMHNESEDHLFACHAYFSVLQAFVFMNSCNVVDNSIVERRKGKYILKLIDCLFG